MNFITYASSIHDLGLIKEYGITEVILSDERFSRFAENKDLNLLTAKAKEIGLKTVFEWDVISTENDFPNLIREFDSLDLNFIDAIRVQDPGVLEFILENTSKPIQYICETGNHNLTGLKTWRDYIGKRLDRLILSIELNKDKLKEYKQQLNVDIETMVLGPILLFYSPRHLLSPLSDESAPEQIKALADSEESPHKGFPVTQNRHGTFMFHIKNLFLLDKLTELMDTGIDFFRVDLRDLVSLDLLEYFSGELTKNKMDRLKEFYPKDVIRGYFQINKSDVLFKKLKNYRIQRKDEDYIGEVIETGKPDYMAIKILTDRTIKVGDTLKMINPEGKIYHTEVVFLKNIKNEVIDKAGLNELVLMNYRGGVWPKSQLYLE